MIEPLRPLQMRVVFISIDTRTCIPWLFSIQCLSTRKKVCSIYEQTIFCFNLPYFNNILYSYNIITYNKAFFLSPNSYNTLLFHPVDKKKHKPIHQIVRHLTGYRLILVHWLVLINIINFF